MAKKLIAGGAVVLAALLYIVLGNRNGSEASTDNSLAAAEPTSVPVDTTNPAAESSGSANPPASAPRTPADTTPPPASAGQYKNGTYKGSVADAVYGSVQVSATISGGTLTSVKLLQYPNAPGHTSEVSQFALPQLVQEAISAQSASVDVVSGATQTSEAFQQSLGAALSAAAAS